MEELITTLTQNAHYAYLILFFYSLGGGMVALLAAGVLASTGVLDITLCIVVAGVANFLGDEGLFYFARINKKDALPYFAKHRRKLALAQILFRKYGSKIILAKKYIYGLKTLIPLAIGITKYDAKKFLVINAVCAVIWALSLGLLSFLAGDGVSLLSQKLGQNSATLLCGLAVLLALIWLYFSKTTKKEKR